MNARKALAELIRPHAPETWAIYDYPANLAPFDDPAKPIALVIEQRAIEAGQTSPDENGIPVRVELYAWVVVDGSRGVDRGGLEDTLEGALEDLLDVLSTLPQHVWDGRAERANFDPQKPAYRVTITGPGTLTPKE